MFLLIMHLMNLFLIFIFFLFLSLIIESFCATEISNLGVIFFDHKNIQRLQIPMNNFLRMQIMQSKTQMYEYFPNNIINKGFIIQTIRRTLHFLFFN